MGLIISRVISHMDAITRGFYSIVKTVKGIQGR